MICKVPSRGGRPGRVKDSGGGAKGVRSFQLEEGAYAVGHVMLARSPSMPGQLTGLSVGPLKVSFAFGHGNQTN